jgi:thioredoxin family protein
VAMLPHEKALVERLKDQPFALLGINSDGDAETLKGILKERGISWRQACDGDTSGPLATQWNVNGWPTIFVLDAQGVIRYRDVRDEEMEKAVLELLAEAKAKK